MNAIHSGLRLLIKTVKGVCDETVVPTSAFVETNYKLHLTKKLSWSERCVLLTHCERQREGRIQILPIQYPSGYRIKRWLDSFTASSQRWTIFCIFLTGRHNSKSGTCAGPQAWPTYCNAVWEESKAAHSRVLASQRIQHQSGSHFKHDKVDILKRGYKKQT